MSWRSSASLSIEAVDGGDRLHERLAGDLDPQVHRVERGETRAAALLADRALQVGLDVGEEQHLALARRGESLGSNCSKTPSRVSSVSRLLRSQPYSPAQKNVSPAGDMLDVADVDPAGAQHVELGLAEVVADRADDAHLVEERGGQREMHGGAAEHSLALAKRRLDRVEGDRSDDCDRHAGRQPYFADSAGDATRGPAPATGAPRCVLRPRGSGRISCLSMTTFKELGLSEPVLAALREIGYESPSPIQEQAIPPLLAGRDVIGQAQTGTGKTAAFGLPMVEYIDPELDEVQALVLTPTRELCIQVTQALRVYGATRGVDVVAVFGGAPIRNQEAQLRGGGHIVVGTVGRVLDLVSRASLVLHDCRYVVLDEADEMLDLGFPRGRREDPRGDALRAPDGAVLGDHAAADPRARRPLPLRPPGHRGRGRDA